MNRTLAYQVVFEQIPSNGMSFAVLADSFIGA